MTIDDLCTLLDARGIPYVRDGATVRVHGHLDLRSLTTLPEGVSLSAGAGLDLRSLTTLPEGVSLSAGAGLYLSSLTTLPEGVSLSAGAGLYLSSLTTLPEGVSLSAGGYLYLPSLTTLPESVSLSAGAGLDLPSLTTLPEGVSLSAGAGLDLRSLTHETQRYQGQDIRLRTIDGICTRLITSRRVGDIMLWSAQYFRGDLDVDPRCYVAERDGVTAHGDTAERALRDLRFKLAAASLDPDELVADIKRRGVVRFNDYRLLTGACDSGLREGLRARGLDPDTEELPLAQALELCRGAYGGERFRALLLAVET
ncbi:MAG: hypothetical protein AB7K73_15150 [Gammaproteobacteria bacterium]